MLQVKPLSTKDFDFAVELANTMDWKMAPADFEFMHYLEPHGSFLLVDDSKRLGIATCISYGKLGWFGNFIINAEYRQKGGGTVLLKYAIDFLHEKGVKTIGIYAYPKLIPFYSRFGFKCSEDFSFLHIEKLGAVEGEELPKINHSDHSKILDFDAEYFGGERQRLLDTILTEDSNLKYCVFEGQDLIGYALATVYDHDAWVGPLICKDSRPEVAFSLIKTVLSRLFGKTVYAVVPKKAGALLDLFCSLGFREEFFVSRMFLGESVGKNCIYLAESLERG